MTPSPAYFAYVGLLRRLHQLIAQGAGDSLDADAVRDAIGASFDGGKAPLETRLFLARGCDVIWSAR